MQKSSLSGYKRDITSQNGEDGIIAEIFSRISPTNKICIEFGAWDGKHLSNVWNLWHNEGWGAVLIEADSSKHVALKESTKAFPGVHTMNRFVEASGENALDSLLQSKDVPVNVDLLSIDIDGNDYYVFESLKKYKPRLIIVEYNPTVPPYYDVVQGNNEYFGASASALLKLAHKKGYKLAAITDTNLFLVVAEEFDKLGIPEVDLIAEFPQRCLVYVMTTYDGQAMLSGDLPYRYRMHTYENEVRNGFRLHHRLVNFLMRFFDTKTKKIPVLNSDIDHVPVKIFKDEAFKSPKQ
ncbi:FkbM family methyltransferase [Polluticoccus soli]|uniref:FkbM family methyltransferase n=1 Tax=Polluticoccus soli TaxID=3034150 RepID=UPI0023E31576|nr:FkbM family methyltransferase [Flavipsychrobacter sp. JY13-12]